MRVVFAALLCNPTCVPTRIAAVLPANPLVRLDLQDSPEAKNYRLFGNTAARREVPNSLPARLVPEELPMTIDCTAPPTTPVLWSARWRVNLRRRVHRNRLSLLALACVAAFELVGAQQQHAAPPVPSAVPPNASRVTALVRDHKLWPPGALGNTRPLVAPDATFWSLQLELVTTDAAQAGVAHLAEASRTVEAFSDRKLPEHLVGKRIAATLTLTGDTDGARWTIKDFKELP